MLNYCHSPATDLDSWRWKEDSDCLLRHLEKHKSLRFTTHCTKVLFLLCFCAVICIVLLVKRTCFFLFKAILKFCTSCILSQAFTRANGEIVRSLWGLQFWCNTFFFVVCWKDSIGEWVIHIQYTAPLSAALWNLYHINIQKLTCTLSAFCSWQFAYGCQQVFNNFHTHFIHCLTLHTSTLIIEAAVC